MEPEVLGLIIGIIFAVNAFLFGLYNALGFIKDKTTKWEGDNKLYEIVGKILGMLQKLIEIIGPITAHPKEPPKSA